jgi:alpha-glucoside transport system substrate-binding protein
MRRRDALRSLVLITIAGEAIAGCGARSVRVAVSWSGWELTQFRKIVATFPGAKGWQVDVLSAGDDVPALLSDRVAAAAAPDIAMLSEPGVVRANRRSLLALQGAPEVPLDWRLLAFDGRVYGEWFKVAHKSLVWFRPDLLGRMPDGWDDWVAGCAEIARAGRSPLAIGAADGWVLADWFSNVLLSVDPNVYRAFVKGARDWRHPSVARTLTRLAEIWGIPGVFPGGVERALVTQYDESVIDVFLHGNAAMVAGADFYYPIIKQFGDVSAASWFPFPRLPAERQPLVVGGDAAVLLRPGGTGGRELINWLTGQPAAQIWARQGGLLSLDPAVTGYPPLLADLARQVRDNPVDFGFFDELSDRLPAADGRGSWKILQDFFAAVAERGSAAGPGGSTSGPGGSTAHAEPAIAKAIAAFERADRGR